MNLSQEEKVILVNGLEALNKTGGVTLGQSHKLIQLSIKLQEPEESRHDEQDGIK